MSAFLVGSEISIRDRSIFVSPLIDVPDIMSVVCAGVMLRCEQCMQRNVCCVQKKSVQNAKLLRTAFGTR